MVSSHFIQDTSGGTALLWGALLLDQRLLLAENIYGYSQPAHPVYFLDGGFIELFLGISGGRIVLQVDCSRYTLVILLAVRCSSVYLCFPGLTRGPCFFTVHEEHLAAVALTGCARGDHTHQLASYFLVRSSTALRLLSGEQLCFSCTVLS